MTENLICGCTQNGRVGKRQLQQRKKQAKEQRCQQQNDTRHETKRFLSHFMPPFGQNWKGIRERERQGFFVDIEAKYLEEQLHALLDVLTANEFIDKFHKWERVIADHPTGSGKV